MIQVTEKSDGITDINTDDPSPAFPWQGTPEVTVVKSNVAAEINWTQV